MRTILEEKYIKIEYDTKNKLTLHSWKSDTIEMNDNEYRTTADKQTVSIEENRSDKLLIDMTEFDFTLSPQTQRWVDKKCFPRVSRAGIKYIAFVICPNLFSQISVEQLMEAKNVKTADFEIQYFDERKEAMKWLLSFKTI